MSLEIVQYKEDCEFCMVDTCKQERQSQEGMDRDQFLHEELEGEE